MKRILTAVAVSLFCLLPVLASADEEQVPTEKEVMEAEGMPPLIPHPPRIIKGTTGDATCLICHEEGKNSAPQTPHAERRGCTQCHVQGEIKGKAAKKGKKK